MDKTERILRQSPLLAFSVYTQLQVEVLNTLAREIINLVDLVTDDVDVETAYDITGKFWLWVIGAYEVTRTMCQAKACFSERLAAELDTLKKRLATIRMPFAKQEYVGKKKIPIWSEASIYGIDHDISYNVKGDVLSVRDLIGQFQSVFTNIKREDILQHHQRSYARGPSDTN